MKAEFKEKNETLMIRLTGRLDAQASSELKALLDENVKDKKAVIFDFKKLSYISSAGLRVLLALRKQLDDDGYIVIKHISDTVRAVFDLTGFADMFILK